MPISILLREFFAALIRKLSWAGLGVALLTHMAIAYTGLWLAGEKHLLEPATFIYFYITTTATVGYGDLAPQSAGGRIFDAVWLMLGGIALITALIGKVTNLAIELWRKRMKGWGDYSARQGHTVLIGWRGEESEKIVRLLQDDDVSNDHRVVLVDCTCVDNPTGTEIDFVKGDTFSSEALMLRAGVRGAARILVHAASDDQTLGAVLTINSLSPKGHVVAHFHGSEVAALARKYAPTLECTSSMSAELLVRSAQDPGSSFVFNELLCVGEGATQFSCRLPATYTASFGALYQRLKEEQNAVLIGHRAPQSPMPTINPASSSRVEGGELFYIADKRLPEGYFA